MQCDYYDAGACRSCTWMGLAYPEQLARLEEMIRGVLAPVIAPETWLPVVPNQESGFRNKAKLVVGGRRGEPTLGILDKQGTGVDLRHCGLYEAGLAQVVPQVGEFVAAAGFTPYDVSTRSGELKHVIITHSPEGRLLTRFVFRSEGQVKRLREWLDQLPGGVLVVTANLQPEHKAILEGPEEIVLSEGRHLHMPINDVVLQLGPKSFFQTSTPMAARLYATARDWVAEVEPTRVLDLYCGVGGFAKHVDVPGRLVHGLEISAEAIECARVGEAAGVSFEVADASQLTKLDAELVIVNPPRRGIGALAGALDGSEAEAILYSSCNPGSLAADLAALTSYAVVKAQVFDMFPQTHHAEVLVLLRRQ